jgi:hypothetical protein
MYWMQLTSNPGGAGYKAQRQQSAGDSVKERLLALVAEKTGYPKDMLDPDLDLEADLGVDTVKQAEVFASDVARSTGFVRDDKSQAPRLIPPSAHVMRFVYETAA